MSFFYDYLNDLNVKNDDANLKILMALNKGICVEGKFSIVNFDDLQIVINVGKTNFKILGQNLKIKSASKNEIVVIGNVLGFIGCDYEQ